MFINSFFIHVIFQEKIQKMKNNENKLEEDKKNLRGNLDDAENRCTKLELARRSIEGDLQRLKLVMNDKETENQVRNTTHEPQKLRIKYLTRCMNHTQNQVHNYGITNSAI